MSPAWRFHVARIFVVRSWNGQTRWCIFVIPEAGGPKVPGCLGCIMRICLKKEKKKRKRKRRKRRRRKRKRRVIGW